jgi:hypothetical protein
MGKPRPHIKELVVDLTDNNPLTPRPGVIRKALGAGVCLRRPNSPPSTTVMRLHMLDIEVFARVKTTVSLGARQFGTLEREVEKKDKKCSLNLHKICAIDGGQARNITQ